MGVNFTSAHPNENATKLYLCLYLLQMIGWLVVVVIYEVSYA